MHGGKRAGAGRPRKYESGTGRLSITIPAELLPLVREIAKSEGLSLSELVSQVLVQELERRGLSNSLRGGS